MPDLQIIALDRSHLTSASDIFNHYVRTTTYSFHIGELGLDKMAMKLGLDREQASFGLIEDGELLGYSVLNPWKAPEAYKGTAEISVYLHPERIASGYGVRLLGYTEEKAVGRGINMLIAGICTENDRSLRVFARAGYEHCAHFKAVGRKFERDLDVIYLQKKLEEPTSSK